MKNIRAKNFDAYINNEKIPHNLDYAIFQPNLEKSEPYSYFGE